jgi:N-acetylmuramoyl-L-alanine amidase
MSSVLTENLFIDTKSDADKLKDPDFLERLARGHTEGIEKAFNLKHKAKSQTQLKNDTGALYRVQVGAFSDRQNAERLVEDLKKHGYSPYISDK